MTKDFKAKDPLDRTVLFYANTWTGHVLKNHPETSFSFEDACNVLTDPDYIVDNQVGPLRKGRSARQSYVKTISTTEGTAHVLVPTKETTKVEIVDETAVEPGAMLAVTAYAVPAVPTDSRRRYSKKKQ